MTGLPHDILKFANRRQMRLGLAVATFIACVGLGSGSGVAAPASLDASGTPARPSLSFQTLPPASAVEVGAIDPLLEPGSLDGSSATDVGSSADSFPDEQPPMIPLPPAVWASFAGLAGVAWRTVRPRRGAR